MRRWASPINLLVGTEGDWGRALSEAETLLKSVQALLALPAEKGALPALHQATDPSVQSVNFVVGAAWPRSGYPSVGKIPAAALGLTAARRLWE
jgi:hypothetical protein